MLGVRAMTFGAKTTTACCVASNIGVHTISVTKTFTMSRKWHPAAAEELTAQGGCESVWLQWKDTRRDDASGFKVLRSTDGKSFSVNSATTRSAAFDGKIDTYFDAAQSDGAWAGIDKTIYRDKTGYVYFGTSSGLDRYDGARMISIPFPIENIREKCWVSGIVEAGDDRLYVGNNAGLFLFDKRTLDMKQVFSDKIDCEVTSLLRTHDDKV